MGSSRFLFLGAFLCLLSSCKEEDNGYNEITFYEPLWLGSSYAEGDTLQFSILCVGSPKIIFADVTITTENTEEVHYFQTFSPETNNTLLKGSWIIPEGFKETHASVVKLQVLVDRSKNKYIETSSFTVK